MKTAIPVIVGYLAWTALWLGGGSALMNIFAEHVGPNQELFYAPALISILGLSVVCSLVSGLVTAAMARQNRSKAVLIMAGLLLLTGIGVQAGSWDNMPVWHHLTFLALLLPVAIAGGKLRN
ncbi:MAG: hypothetical protein ACYTG5_03055 [Planctomycetota bacterium]